MAKLSPLSATSSGPPMMVWLEVSSRGHAGCPGGKAMARELVAGRPAPCCAPNRARTMKKPPMQSPLRPIIATRLARKAARERGADDEKRKMMDGVRRASIQ